MGTWDATPFGNDNAADFAFEFDDAHTIAQIASVLEAALDTVLDEPGEIEAPDGEIAIAAAALVVAWEFPDAADAGYAQSLDPWPRVARPLPEHLSLKAAEVLDRMQEAEENELVELWRETESYSEFVAELTSLRSYFP
ncbi:DUF4259 domain-containing protein [Jonesiaceae bacterium BS-20]|uniref:DUF4259 domain-containing protein n=1 Tax=Jonesiaceae bacterium BS-20 TaxID=3120821 RepID=A0AAU7DWQ1_9MICO